MLNTSLDVLYLVLALAALILVGFLAWLIFYLGQVIRQVNEIIADFRQRIKRFEEILSFVAKGVKSIGEFLGEKRRKKK